jgi:glycerol-3-phosphate acyltransferase PlsY
MTVIVAILIILLSYWYGCFSTARVLAKSFRSLNIYKIGTGFADTENIYFNVSKPLGLLTGALDIVKGYAWLELIRQVLILMDRMAIPPDLSALYSCNLMLLYGLAVLVGHCLPLTHHLRGGRGIFTYFGILLFFSFYPTLVTGLLALVIFYGFKQMRFAQYTIVILPVLLTQVISSVKPLSAFLNPLHATPLFTTRLLGLAVAMGVLNFIVSKKLGEF